MFLLEVLFKMSSGSKTFKALSDSSSSSFFTWFDVGKKGTT